MITMITKFDIKQITITCLSLIFLLSCSGNQEQLPYNSNGGWGRTNSYEKFGTFNSYNFYIDKYDVKDNSGCMTAPLALDGGRLAVATVGGSLCVVSNDKTEWQTKLDSNLFIAFGMAADINQNIYAVSNTGLMYAYSSDGKLRWKYQHPGLKSGEFYFSDLLALRDGIIAAISPGRILKISFEGKLIWEYEFAGSTTKTISATNGGSILVPSSFNEFGKTDTLLCISSNGKLLWKKEFEKTRILKNPVVSGDMILYPTVYDIYENKLFLVYALDTLGNLKWKKELAVMPRFISITDSKDIIVTGYNAGLGESLSGIFCFGTNGDLKWKQYLDATIPTPVMISKANLAVLGVRKNTVGLYFFNKEGTLEKTLSMSDALPILQLPFVTGTPSIGFAGLDKFFILRVDDAPLNKLFPW